MVSFIAESSEHLYELSFSICSDVGLQMQQQRLQFRIQTKSSL